MHCRILHSQQEALAEAAKLIAALDGNNLPVILRPGAGHPGVDPAQPGVNIPAQQIDPCQQIDPSQQDKLEILRQAGGNRRGVEEQVREQAVHS